MAQSFEELPALQQHLTFDGITSFLGKNKGSKFLQTSKLHVETGGFNNLAYVLSDQNPWCIEVDLGSQVERMSGPIIVQIDAALSLITEHNPPIEIKKRGGLCRLYPSIAVREAMVNAVIHADLTKGDTIKVTLGKDFLTVRSPGDLNIPTEWRDISMTNPRNWEVAELLVDLKYATLRGRGMALMRNSYAGSGLVPCIIKESDALIMKLPAMNNPIVMPGLGASIVAQYLERNRGALISEIARDMMISDYFAKKIVKSMESDNVAFSLGVGSKRRVYLSEPKDETGRTNTEAIR